MNFRQEIFGGVKWTGASMVFVTACHVLMLVILSRFLAPSDFGLMAVMMVVIGVSQAFMDMGISNAIVQRQKISHEQLSSLYWLNVFCGAAISVFVYAAAPLIAAFYGHDNLTDLLRLLAPMFILGALGQQFKVLCQKTMQFRRLALGEMLGAFSALAVAVAGAVQGWGAMAFVLAFLMQAGVSSLYFLCVGLRHHHRPALVYQQQSLEGFISFGLYQMGERVASTLYQNADTILIGKFLGVQALGFYTLAWQICIIPMQRLSPVLGRVLLPLYARMQDAGEDLQAYYTTGLRAVLLVACPLYAVLFFFPHEVVGILYGAGWGLSGELVRALALVGMLRALGNPGGALILAKGRADIGFWWNVLAGAATALVMYITLTLSPSLVIAAWAMAIHTLVLSVVWHGLVRKLGGIAYKPLLIDFTRLLAASMAASGAMALMFRL